MAKRIDLLLIDPQVDFCDSNGALFVPGATEDMQRVASMIDRVGEKINRIHVTMDCHHFFDIAHPGFWRNSKGENPDPFTIISHQDIVDGIWFPIFAALPGSPNAREYVKEYTKKLEDGGRYPLCIWPKHCLIGTTGNNVLPVLSEALLRWEEKKKNNIDYVSKGSNIKTEHFSGIKSEIPDSQDPTTQLNTRLIKTLMETDSIICAGEAGSHCLKFSIEDIAEAFGSDDYLKKITLLTDGTSPVISPVVDFPSIQNQFIEDMKLRGMKVTKTTDF